MPSSDFEKQHPRNVADGRFVRSQAPPVQDEVRVSLRQQADQLHARRAKPEPDRTPWKIEMDRIRGELDELNRLVPDTNDPIKLQAAVAELGRRPDGTIYVHPAPNLRRHEELIREAGTAIDAEIQARIGPPPEEVTSGAQRERAMLRALTGLAERQRIMKESGLPAEDPSLVDIGHRLETAQELVARHTLNTVEARSLYSARYTLEMTDMLSQIRPLGGRLEIRGRTSTEAARAVSAVSELFPSDWIEASNAHDPPLRIHPEFQDRGFYDYRRGTIGLAAVPGDISDEHVAVAVHESAHRFVAANDGLAMAEWTFFHRRTAGPDGHPAEPVPGRDLTGNLAYEEGEVCCPDRWVNPYVGLVYVDAGAGDPFEIIPVGIESLHTGANGLYEDDDYRTFVVGVLAME